MMWEWWRERAKSDGPDATREAVDLVSRHRDDLERRAELVEAIIEAIRREDDDEVDEEARP
jgi:hypothetical protein